jgi:predicted DCC family thiol-disulfide oxidoreductase YuxK
MRLTVLYDDGCAICVRCRDWMQEQSSYVPLQFLPCSSAEARRRVGPAAAGWLRQELLVVADDGRVWAGAAAFLVCLWALVEWREWSYRLSGPTLAPLASRFFHAISRRRRGLAWLARLPKETCDAGTCNRAAGPYR